MSGFGLGTGLALGKVALAPWSLGRVAWIRHYDPHDLAAGAIASWPDHDGVGPTLAQAVGANRLTAVASVLNTRTVARGVAASSQWAGATGGPTLNGGAAFTTVSVFKVTGAGIMIFYHLGNEVSRLTTDAGDMTCIPDDTVTGYGRTAGGIITSNVWHRAIWRYDGTATGNANRLRARVNGVDRVLTFTGTTPATITGGDGAEIGRYYGAAYYLDGDIGLCLTSASCLSNADTDSLDAYLVSTYGLLP